MRWARRSLGGLLALVLGVNLGPWAAVALAAPFFAHLTSVHGLSLYGTSEDDALAAKDRLRAAARLLAESPLRAPERDYRAFATQGDRRSRPFFAPVPEAGGVAYFPFSKRNVFLSGADLGAAVLIKDAHCVTLPRTLTCYLVPEFPHLRIGELTGPVAFHRLPKRIMEGTCEFVALGPMSPAEIEAVTIWIGTPLERMQAHGSYPLARAAVSFAQEALGISPKALISEPTSWARVAAVMADAGYSEVTTWH